MARATVTVHVAGVVGQDDVLAAQAVLDELTQVAEETSTAEEYAATARGVLTRWSADVRTAGYLAGVQAGRRAVAAGVRDALDGEGL